MTDDLSKLTLRFLAQPTEVNFGGKIHGGAVMKWIDQAGWAAAVAWAGRYCVTAYIGGISFEKPMTVGQLIEVRAQVAHTGRTSMHIVIDVYAGDPKQPNMTLACHCITVFVATDDDGKPTPVTTYVPKSDAERELQIYAQHFMELRKQTEAERAAFLTKRSAQGLNAEG
jgi:uncharacterized protein (TIGR00369 family)